MLGEHCETGLQVFDFEVAEAEDLLLDAIQSDGDEDDETVFDEGDDLRRSAEDAGDHKQQEHVGRTVRELRGGRIETTAAAQSGDT